MCANVCAYVCASQRERGDDSEYVGWGGVDCEDSISAGSDSDTCNDCRSAAQASVTTAIIALVTSVPQLMTGVNKGWSLSNVVEMP